MGSLGEEGQGDRSRNVLGTFFLFQNDDGDPITEIH